MRVLQIFSLFALPLLSLAQNAQVTTSMITSVGLGPNRQETTVVQATVFTIAAASQASQSASPSGTNSASSGGNSSSSGNATGSATVTSNLPTAPSTVAGDGSAPSPGASAPGGIYGPPDGYIAAATALQINAAIVGLIGAVVGGALVFA